jgi:hypothetical protein
MISITYDRDTLSVHGVVFAEKMGDRMVEAICNPSEIDLLAAL